MSSIRARLSSSKWFDTDEDNRESLSAGTLGTTKYNYMTASYNNNEYLTDSGIFGVIAPVIYQTDLLRNDLEDLHNQISKSQHTEEEMVYGTIKAVGASFENLAVTTKASLTNTTLIKTGSFDVVSSSLIPDKDDTYSLGSSGKEWDNLYVDGTAYIDTLNISDVITGPSFVTIVNGDTSPDARSGNNLITNNRAATSITTFDNGVDGQEIFVVINDANTTFVDETTRGSALALNGSRNWTAGVSDTITLIWNNAQGKWYEKCRSDNS